MPVATRRADDHEDVRLNMTSGAHSPATGVPRATTATAWLGPLVGTERWL
jgi:hypothetical protein